MFSVLVGLNSTQLYCDIFAAQRAELLIEGQQLINDKYKEKDKVQNTHHAVQTRTHTCHEHVKKVKKKVKKGIAVCRQVTLDRIKHNILETNDMLANSRSASTTESVSVAFLYIISS